MTRGSILLALGLAMGCGKSATPVAKGLAYRDPAGSGWRLVKGAASTPQLLVLELLAPAGGAGRGVALTLRADPRTSWDPARVGAVYALGAEPHAVMAELRGQDAVLGVFQKGQTPPASYGDWTTPVLSVTLRLGPSQEPLHGAALPLQVAVASHLSSTGEMEDVAGQLQVGVLTAE